MQGNNPRSTIGPDLNEFSQNVNFTLLDKSVDFIYLRASGSASGSFRVDKKFVEFARQCRGIGKPCGAYHFAMPYSNLETADEQCDKFIETLYQAFGEGDCGDLFPVLDIERPAEGTMSNETLVAWIQRFVDRFHQKTRRRMMLYFGYFYLRGFNGLFVQGKGYPLSKMPLWIALYHMQGNPVTPPDIGGWDRWMLWQFTSRGQISGVDNPVDLNWGPDSLDELMPPPNVQGLRVSMSQDKIYANWAPVNATDLWGYNLFVNSYYAGTTTEKQTSFVIDKSKFYLPKGRDIVVGIEAFDKYGDVSRQRSTRIIEN